MKDITYENLIATHDRIRPYIHRTPVLISKALNGRTGREVHLKCENFQRAGSFKVRGVTSFLSSLSADELRCGVVTHSSGNHAQALALGARIFNTKAYVVMPENAPVAKREAAKGYGAEITLCGATMAEREAAAASIVANTDAVMVHPYDHPYTILGQGSAALELLVDAPFLDVILAPISGGGLISGTALAARGHEPRVRVVGVEPEQAGEAYRSLEAGHLISEDAGPTIADGLRAQICERTFRIIQDNVERIVLVTDEEIYEAMVFLWERVKIVVEPSGATALAALLFHGDAIPGDRVGVLVSGGNLDVRKSIVGK